MATNKVLIEGSSSLAVSHAQMKELHRQLEVGSLNGFHIQALLRHENPFALSSINIYWTGVYKFLGMSSEWKEEIENLLADTSPDHFDVYVLKGVTPNKVVKALRELGVNMYLYTDDLDEAVPTNDRDPQNGSYRVRFKKTIEADPELLEKSAEDLEKEGVKGITLLERLLLGLGYFMATGNHLDIENITLCSGSRDSGGSVPGVDWVTDGRKVYVYWFDVSDSHPGLCSRAVVS